LEAHPAVAWVRYPYLPSHPFYAAARRQMANGSGMMSFGLRASFEGARRIMGRLHLIVRAVSLGDAESLIMHPASLTRARQKTRPEAKLATGVGEDLVRMSIGLEDADDLLDDLEQALRGF
jgi:methionine-gamma-lyase